MNALKQLSLIGLTSLLVACGGGGGGDSTPTNNGGSSSGGSTGGSTGGNTGGNNSGGQTATLESELGKWIVDMADGYIIPAYQEVNTSAKALEQATQACSQADFNQTQLTSIQNAWQQAFGKWQSIQWLKLGPVVNESRLFRLQTWPDSNNAVPRGVEQILTDTGAINPQYLSSKNVGAQGFPAVELLLYPDNANQSLLIADNKARRCEALQGIAANIVAMSDAIATGWATAGGNYRATFVNGTGEFTGKVDVVEEVLTNYLEHLELVKDEKLLTPLSLNKPGIPTVAESPRSDTSLQYAQINVQALIDIYTAKDGHGFDDILNVHLEQTSIATQLTEALNKTKTDINSLSGSFTNALNDDAARAKINDVINSLRDVRTVLSADFAQALELTLGFNSNDGD